MNWLLLSCALLLALSAFIWARFRKKESEFVEKLIEGQEANEQLAAHAANYQQKLRALSDSSGAGMVILDRSGRVVDTNSAAETLLNSARSDLMGHALIQATLSSDLDQFVARALSIGRALTQEFQMPGTPSRVLLASVHPLAMGLSGVPETMLVLVDVTELHRLETIRRDFVANVSHELRTPLASIRAMAETLHEGARHDETVAGPFLETIISETDRLARISQDLLILSDAESKAPAKEKINLSELLEEVVSRSQKLAEQTGVSLKLRVRPNLSLTASRDQIEQVLVNLVDNAIKYTASNGSVCVEAGSESGKITICVSDTGIGIRQQDLPRIFERFYRVDKARSRESGGTGLGLSIVKNIVEGHGGHVKVLSEFKRGSTFTVTIPNTESP